MDTPSLYYRTESVKENIAGLRSIMGPSGKILFSVKAFPSPQFLQFVDRFVDGFDASNSSEIALVSKLMAPILSVSGPMAGNADASISPKRCFFYANTLADLRTTPSNEGHIRVCVTDFLRTVSPVHASRFGVRRDELAVAVENHDQLAFHFHAPIKRMVNRDMICRFLEFLCELGVDTRRITTINLGGGWEPGSLRRLKQLNRLIYEQLACDVHVEPGSGLLVGAGLALARVLNFRRVGFRNYITLDLSPELHLRWSRPRFMDARLHGDDKIFLCGPTNFEGDYIEIRGNFDAVCSAEVIVLEGVVSYSSAWNSSFNGVAKVPVVID